MPQNERSSDLIFLIIAVGISLALRLDFLIASHFVIDSDEAIVGLMAKHILEGRGIPTFYYGQHYMGSLEAILTACVFSLIGMSSAALKVVPLIFSLLLIPLVHGIGRELWDIRAGRVAALLATFPPAALLEWGTKARGGFIEVLVLGGFALLLTIRFLKGDLKSIAPLFLIGLVLGLGWWTNNQVIFFGLPIGLFILMRMVSSGASLRAIPALFLGLIAFIIGGLPFWIYNLNEDWASFEMFEGVEDKDLSKHLFGLFNVSLPILSGAKRFWGRDDVIIGSTFLAAAIYLALFIAYFVGRRRELREFYRGRIDSKSPTLILVLFFFTCCAVFALSSFGYLVEAPRYLLPIYVGLFPFVGIASSFLPSYVRAFAIVGILALHLSSSYWGGRAIPGEPFVFGHARVARNHSEIINWLNRKNYTLIRTNYWIGYRLAFETEERIKFLMFHTPYRPRIGDYELLAEGVKKFRTPILLVQEELSPVTTGLRSLGYTFKVKKLRHYAVIHKIKPLQRRLKVTSSRVTVSTSIKNDSSSLMIDDKVETRWGSGMPQAPGMLATFSFNPPITVRGIKYSLGKFVTDYPRELIIRGVTNNGSKVEILSPINYKHSRALIEGATEIMLYTKPRTLSKVEFEQIGRDTLFDWSIAEIEFYE